MKLSSIDTLWNAIPDDAKLKMPFGIYEEVWNLHKQDIIEAHCDGAFHTDWDESTDVLENAQDYYSETFK